jgi:hypothetical protein
MKARLLLGCATGALLIDLGSFSPAFASDGMQVDSTNVIDYDWIASALTTYQTPVAAAKPYPVKAKPPVDTSWWFHGYMEAGGRLFVNDPQRNGITALGGGSSLAKYYEYSTDKPGPSLNGHVATGSGDGLYRVDLWAKNVGYSDQFYNVDASKAGEYYLNFQWDQIPHVYSTSAQTFYNGVGTNALTLPPGLANKVFGDAGCVAGSPPTGCVNPMTGGHAANVAQDILQNLHGTDIGIRRDTASVESRWTPTNWDVRTNYSDTHRFGTQVDGVVMASSTSSVVAQVPKPVDDNTQNFGVSGEYLGTSPWSQKFNIKLSYGGSKYTDNFNSYTVQNLFCPTGAVGDQCARNGGVSSPLSLVTLPPDNQANMFGITLGADLPLKNRYIATVSYDMMRQNEAFLPFTVTPTFSPSLPGFPGLPAGWTGSTAAPANSVAALPAASLNGAINTVLVNNVLTTEITPDLKSKASYRYYGSDNGTPLMFFRDWVVNDAAASTSHKDVGTLSPGYTKQNAGEELTWRPTSQWNIGTAYGYERYNWSFADVDATNESSGRVYTDWKPTGWATLRGSGSYSERRSENYNYMEYVGSAQWPIGGGNYASAFRQYNLDDRDRMQAKFQVDVDVIRGLTVSPVFGMKNDDYHLNLLTEEGAESDHAWNTGMDVSYVFSPDTNILVSYLYEHHDQIIADSSNSPPPFTPATLSVTDVQDVVNTVTVVMNHAVIPNKLDVKVGYAVSLSTDSQPLFFANGTGPTAATGGQYPDVKTAFQRLEVLAKYKFDDEFMHRMGWNGKMTAQLGYKWERNSVQNWQNDMMLPYMFSTFAAAGATNTMGYMTWLAYDNPNYNVQMVSASLAWSW